MNLNSREQALTFQLMETLHSSLDLSEVMNRSWELMRQLLAADYVALCIS